jgi:hypothetical protein
MSTVIAHREGSVAELVAALRAQRTLAAEDPVTSNEPPSGEVDAAVTRTLLVIGAHAGAGATMVSVAVADALGELPVGSGVGPVRLIDAAPHEGSGLVAATAYEVGWRGSGWRAGRRGSSMILRPAGSPTSPADVPSFEPSEAGWLVIDAGWPWRAVTAARNPIEALVERAKVLVVCRATVPGVRQVEVALDALPADSFVAGVGAGRWPAVVEASFGPRLARTVAEGRAVLFPSDRRVEVNGIAAEALPAALVGAAGALVAAVWPDVVGSHRPRARGFRR